MLTPQERTVIAEAREILARYITRKSALTSFDQLVDYCHMTIARDRVERFHVLFLDRKNQLIEDRQMGAGGIDHVGVYPREIARAALELDASAVILVHNHPSGDPTPSQADITMTRQIIDALKVFEIVVHDHLIIGAGREFSLRCEGMM